MNTLHLLTLIAGFFCFAAFSWGVKGHFRSTGRMPAGMKLTSGLSLILFCAFAARLAETPAAGSLPSLVLFAAAAAVFAWAIGATRKTPPTLAFDTDQPSFLLRHGPYRFVRHPFYLAYLLFWTGTATAAPGLLPWIAPVLMLALYAHAAAREEQKFAGSPLAPEYARYRTRAGMFLPLPSALLAG